MKRHCLHIIVHQFTKVRACLDPELMVSALLISTSWRWGVHLGWAKQSLYPLATTLVLRVSPSPEKFGPLKNSATNTGPYTNLVLSHFGLLVICTGLQVTHTAVTEPAVAAGHHRLSGLSHL